MVTAVQRRVLEEALASGREYVVAKDRTIQALWALGVVTATGKVYVEPARRLLGTTTA